MFAVSAKVRAPSTHTRHRFILVNCDQVVVRNSREEKKPWQPFAVCDSRSQDFSRHRCACYFTSKWKGSHPLSHDNYLWENWDCLSYIETKAWFWELLGVTPSLLASVKQWPEARPQWQGRLQWVQASCLQGLPAPSWSWSWCRSLWVLLADSLASVRQVVRAIPSGNCCCIIWQCCRLLVCALFLFHYLLFCLGCFCFNTLMPADSVGGKAEVESW